MHQETQASIIETYRWFRSAEQRLAETTHRYQDEVVDGINHIPRFVRPLVNALEAFGLDPRGVHQFIYAKDHQQREFERARAALESQIKTGPGVHTLKEVTFRAEDREGGFKREYVCNFEAEVEDRIFNITSRVHDLRAARSIDGNPYFESTGSIWHPTIHIPDDFEFIQMYEYPGIGPDIRGPKFRLKNLTNEPQEIEPYFPNVVFLSHS